MALRAMPGWTILAKLPQGFPSSPQTRTWFLPPVPSAPTSAMSQQGHSPAPLSPAMPSHKPHWARTTHRLMAWPGLGPSPSPCPCPAISEFSLTLVPLTGSDPRCPSLASACSHPQGGARCLGMGQEIGTGCQALSQWPPYCDPDCPGLRDHPSTLSLFCSCFKLLSCPLTYRKRVLIISVYNFKARNAKSHATCIIQWYPKE